MPVAKLVAVARQDDGKFLVAGYPHLASNALPGRIGRYDDQRPRIGRIHERAGADLSFGPNGSGAADLANAVAWIHPNAIHIGPDRGIIVAGVIAANPGAPGAATRLAIGKLYGDASAPF